MGVEELIVCVMFAVYLLCEMCIWTWSLPCVSCVLWCVCFRGRIMCVWCFVTSGVFVVCVLCKVCMCV